MGKISNTDKSIRNIMRWADSPEWSGEQSAVFDSHLNPLCDRLGISQGELAGELEQHGYNGMLFGIMFEDFLSRRLPPDDRNVIDDYLKRRGWRETVPGKRYLQQIRDSVLSLYEVVEVSPGKHCDLRDLVRDRNNETIRVFEHMGTQNLVKWDRLAARVLKSKDRHIFAGGILPFPRDAAQDLLHVLSEGQQQFDTNLSVEADKGSRNKGSSSVTPDLFLQISCPAFTLTWLTYTLERLQKPLPEVTNREGEALVFTETRFPYLDEQSDSIVERLDAAPEWERDHPDNNSWVWFPQQEAIGDKPQHGLACETFQGGERQISGALELKARALTLSANSVERARRAQEMLETLLHGLVGPALSVLETPEQMMAEHETGQQGDSSRGAIREY